MAAGVVMVDFGAFAARVRGMLVAPDATFASDGRPAPRWAVVAREHALPLIVSTSIVNAVLLMIFPPTRPDGTAMVLDWTGAALVVAGNCIANFLGLMVMATVVRFFAGRLGGTASFDAGFVLAALATTPLFLVSAILPVFGLVAALVGLVYALVLFYRGLVPVMDVPPHNRGRVFGLSLVTLVGIFLAAGVLLLGLQLGV